MAAAMFFLAGAGSLHAQRKPLRLVLSPASTIPSADIVKNLVSKCPNVSITLNSKKSDFMLEAGGWSGNYKFTVFQKGGRAVFSTSTMMLSNAVKDVCRFVNSAQATEAMSR
ncbi:MAG: hypothetical protein ACRD4S_16390 [Candidatus Acidiferrales bacterium]